MSLTQQYLKVLLVAFIIFGVSNSQILPEDWGLDEDYSSEAEQIISDLPVYPVAVFHGMGDWCGNPGMGRFTKQISQQVGVYAKCVEYGASIASFFTSMDFQVEKACKDISETKEFQGQTISVIGLSQGGLIARAIVERCQFGGQVKRFVSIGGPQNGIATLPGCFKGVLCNLINGFIDLFVYYPIIQNNIGPAGYFRDPKNQIAYYWNSSFLPLLNNERNYNISQYQLFSDLEIVQLTMFNNDTVINPPSTAWFYFYSTNGETIIPVEQSRLYQEDLIGLKKLNLQGKVQFVALNGGHLQFSTQNTTNIFVPALKGILPNITTQAK